MAGAKQKGKQNDKGMAKKKAVHAKPAAKKGQPFASLSKHKQQPHQQQKRRSNGASNKKQLTKEQEAMRQQRLVQQRSFEERMRSQKNPPQPKPMPSFVLAPPTFTLPSSSNGLNTRAQPSAFVALMDPLLTTSAPAAPSGPRIQPTISRPANVFAVLEDHDDTNAATVESVNPFAMRPPTFQIPGPPTFHMARPSFQLPDDDDDDL
ncbi:hypothetical protein H257_09216 [Aphanomyces astaci]|uniref:Uncharacterized protein n=1 Tax=Aphanomyces astaci TaxID=112090 RepID=W4GBU1_APHAT|nr:hypothetical protein H257_09216 [Aphanomyces astaci]ETV76756.1 hypothetical protein H257_09216 [Aphanomyces astaci]|eukprot:XP_009833668.1 hypothetical protein H257_09216 [Aphanomyces astaci]